MDWYAASDPEILENLGERLRLARMAQGKTQQMLADQTGLHRTTLRDMENGRPANMLSWIQLLRGLDRLESLGTLLPGTDDSPVLAKLSQERKRVRTSGK